MLHTTSAHANGQDGEILAEGVRRIDGLIGAGASGGEEGRARPRGGGGGGDDAGQETLLRHGARTRTRDENTAGTEERHGAFV